MRFMVLVKASKESEAGALPTKGLLTEMGKYNEQLAKAGVMLDGEGLHPSSRGARVRFSGKERTVIDGPFTETKGADSRLLGLEGEIQGRSHRVAHKGAVRRRSGSGDQADLRAG